ncbi:GTP-binding protein [Gordonia alkaliphila]|uniref:CobW family GTP-binding protein n=1 Tax=Gordonia alkaliphila TaxID=1053547 RepID=UPI001FF25037|nr:GTP-binding protein [Gordonia alkaliphila]MCK0438175.1 GTP-binding protein [Gordonia alkaliphila]
MTARAVPVVVLAGFLGAGKTTVLNHLLRHADGRRFGVLVNDFGAVNIDALLVSGQSAGRLDLANGCICCTTDAEGLREALAALAASGVDAIVIEASGIAEPKALVRLVLAARDERVAYGGLVYLVDAAHVEQTLAEHPAVAGHVGVADLVVCSKTDLVSADQLARVRGTLAGLNPTAPIVSVVGGVVDPGFFAEGIGGVGEHEQPRQLSIGELLDDEPDYPHGHLHEAFESVSLDAAGPVDPRRLAAFLERPPAGAYRCKGLAFVDLPGHRERAYEVHAVGGFVRVGRRPWPGGVRATSLVTIGAGLDVDATRAAMADVLVPADPADENGILHLTRHLVTGD